MAIPSESFEVQSESPVDFASLRRNGMNMEPLISVQEMFPYFDMLNGPTYVMLVKDFWARAEVYDLEAALTEEDDTVIRKEDHRELRTDLKESSVISNLMDDFPPICKNKIL